MQCGEPLAIQQYLVNNPDKSIIGKGKVSTYGVQAGDPTNVAIKDPCAVSKIHQPKYGAAANAFLMQEEHGKWGCQIFLDKLSVDKVGKQGDTPDLPYIQPVMETPHCFLDLNASILTTGGSLDVDHHSGCIIGWPGSQAALIRWLVV